MLVRLMCANRTKGRKTPHCHRISIACWAISRFHHQQQQSLQSQASWNRLDISCRLIQSNTSFGWSNKFVSTALFSCKSLSAGCLLVAN